MTVKTDSYILGINPDDTRNFLLDTDGAGALRIRRRADGSGGLLATFDAAGNLQLGASTNANAGRMVLATAQNTTSGTAIDFTGIPSWAKRITVMFNGVSLSGTSVVQVQLGTSGGVENTGYVSVWSQGTQNGAGTSGFVLFGATATDTRYGALVISNFATNAFSMQGATSSTAGASVSSTVGFKTLAGTLDRIRITSVNGTDTFDGGSANIIYEG